MILPQMRDGMSLSRWLKASHLQHLCTIKSLYGGIHLISVKHIALEISSAKKINGEFPSHAKINMP